MAPPTSADLSGWFYRKVFVPFCQELWPDVFFAEACDAPPGSETKIKVLRERCLRGLPLWHPRDAVLALRDVLLYKARGGDQVAMALAVEVPPVEGDAYVREVEKRQHTKRYRSASEQAFRATPEYKVLENQRRKRERERRKAAAGQVSSSDVAAALR